MSFYYCFSAINALSVLRVETTWRLRENLVSALFRVEYTWSVSRNLAGGFFSTDIFEKFNSFFTQ